MIRPLAPASADHLPVSAATAVPSTPEEADGPDPVSLAPTVRTLWRRYRIALLVVLIVLVVALGIGVVSRHGVHGRLDPRAVDTQGSRALATLLGDHGVEVRRVTSVNEAAAQQGDRHVVLVAFPDLLPPAALRPFGDPSAGRVVLVAPGAEALAAVTDDVRPVGAVPVTVREAGCSAQPAVAAGAAELGGLTYHSSGTGIGCYGAEGVSPLLLSRTRGGAELVVLGTGDLLTNGRLAEQGNAALALNLLGADGTADRVTWLVAAPGAATTDGGTVSLSDIVPSWVLPAAVQLLFAALLAALWRARRLGPPVTEPLPVVVRAAETVEGRARLYRRAQARDRAGEALRAGALARLVPRMGLDPSTGGEPTPAAVVEAVAVRSGIPPGEVQEALYGSPPPDDPRLVRLADTLDTIVRSTLDSEVRRS